MRIAKLVLVSILLLAWICGCSEERQSPLEVVSKTSRTSAPDGSITGTLELPDNSQFDPEDVKIMVGEEEITAYATGDFFVPVPDVPQMIVALTPDDRILFFGVIDPRGEQTTLGPESTAIELTFLTCMLYALPANLHYEAIDMVAEKRAVQDFGAALKREFRGNPSASLAEILPEVQSELEAAVSAVNDELVSYMNQFVAPPLEISPTERQSGCEVTRSSQDPEGQINIKNYYRRYVYAISHKPGANEALVSEFVGMGKTATNFSTIEQFFSGNIDPVPAQESMELPLTAQRDEFQIDVVGPTLKPSDGQLQWREEQFISSGATVGMLYIIPLIKHIAGSSLEPESEIVFSTANVYLLFGLEIYDLINNNSDLREAYEGHQMIRMVWHTAKLLQGSSTFQTVVRAQFGRSAEGGLFDKAFPVFKVFDVAAELVNAGVATVQWGNVERLVTFDAIEAEPLVIITEPSDDLSTEDRVIHVRGEIQNFEAEQGIMVVNGMEQIIPIENSRFDIGAILVRGDNLIKVTVGGISSEIKVRNTAPRTTLFVALTWKENESDVDLYVTEPDGQTAWFGIYGAGQEPPFETTNGGELDMNNVEGFGPESYSISLADGDKILPGDYTINVHYYGSHGYTGPVHYSVLILKNELFYDRVDGIITLASRDSALPDDSGKDDSWDHIADIELIRGEPDLIVRSVAVDGESAIGEPVRYTVIVENIDGGTARNIIVKTYVGTASYDLSNEIDQYIIPELRPGDAYTRTLDFVPARYLEQYIIAEVDSDDRIRESREDNNLNSVRLQFHDYERAGMVFIPAGEFEMGDHHGEGDGDEWPIHTIYLDAFYIDKYEVTNAQYARFLNEYGSNTDAVGHELLDIDNTYCLIEKVGDTYDPELGYENHPVIEVTWYGAAAYAQFYGKQLPTEAQWEKAARGGLEGNMYPWGDSINHSSANYSGTGGRDAWDSTSRVGSFAPNGYNLYDMAGNVWEWCADVYDLGYYRTSSKNNPMGPGVTITFRNDDFVDTNDFHAIRGGGWDHEPHDLRVANRGGYNPHFTNYYFGFRCVSQD